MSLYAQHGYGKSDKIQRGIEDGSIEGVILSPKSEKPENIKIFVNELKQCQNLDILIDPQLYILACNKADLIGKLGDYEFFTSQTINKKYLSIPSNVDNLVNRYFDFQINMNLNKIIAPSIIIENFDSRSSQIALTIANEAMKQGSGMQILQSLCISENAFNDLNQVQDFLDIISLFNVKGFYIIIDRENVDNPNIINDNILTNIMYFMYNLSFINEFEVILGYGDFIGVPIYCTGINTIATGWFNTLRRFSSNDLISRDGGRRANKRYFSNKILNSLLILPEIFELSENRKLNKILSNSKYDSIMYNDLSGSQWSDSINCLHNWYTMKSILDNIDNKNSIEQKVDYMIGLIGEAKLIYSELNEDFLDSKSKSKHLNIWEEALKNFLKMIKE